MLQRFMATHLLNKTRNYILMTFHPSDLSVDKVIGTFTNNMSSDCHIVTVQDNNVAEEQALAMLMITSTTLGSTQFEIQSATISVEDDDGKSLLIST